MFQPKIALDLAKKALGPKSVWMPIIDDALKTCNEHGNIKKNALLLFFIDLIFNLIYFYFFNQHQNLNLLIQRLVGIWAHS